MLSSWMLLPFCNDNLSTQWHYRIRRTPFRSGRRAQLSRTRLSPHCIWCSTKTNRNPNSLLIFIIALSAYEQEQARQLLRALAAWVSRQQFEGGASEGWARHFW
jgi:hypothetical protein